MERRKRERERERGDRDIKLNEDCHFCCSGRGGRQQHTMHAYINQLAEHDVVSCLHFFVLLLLLLFFYRFCACRSFAPSYISSLSIHSLGDALDSAEEAEKYITLGAHKKEELRERTKACICGEKLCI
jgi:hypothetical protein